MPALPFAHGPQWRNHLGLAPLTNKQSHPDGRLSDDETDWLLARADGGFGMVMTAAAYVTPAGKAWDGQLGVHDDAMLPGLTRVAEGLRERGAVSSVQLHHGGLRADPDVSGVRREAPWADERHATRALSTDDVRRAVDDFVAAAVRSERAGFDGVQIHGAHGYLVCEFLDGRHNRREDGYGGSLEDRMRFLLEIVDGVRAATGPDFQLGVRLTPERHGIVLDEALATATALVDGGRVDHLDLSLWDVRKHPHGSPEGSGDDEDLLIDRFTALDRGDVRLTVAGEVSGADDVAWCLEHGADGVLVGTAAILHHDFADRALADAGFRAVPHPVTRAHLAAERVGPAFVDYLGVQWDDMVLD